ncbi:hypothetical protein NEF87_004294 [Candidatus Lokiarchaeum ossiferum]|uniref:Glycosyltransferase subfamily 4-like N-terminal domain-containing protein n=1 Tax=Candidatus Lokiarchaeum ossiferum TaxID=2951803 RepID=A0ABY6HWV1_9ARCH|nr:hypothetical protein NEF87_004294 [Candidatus Lokiarchaeum sp. B-35]
MKKIKIIFYLKGYGNAIPGAESAGYHILQSIIDRNDLKIIIVSDQKAKCQRNEILFKHKNLPINLPILNFIINNFFAKRMIKNVTEIFSPDIIHIQGFSGNYPTLKTQIKKILTLHDDPSMEIYDRNRNDPLKFFEYFWFKFIKWSISKAIRNFDFFHVGSSKMIRALQYQGVTSERIYQIPNGRDNLINKKEELESETKKSIKIADNSIIKMIMVGTIEYRKGTLSVAQSLEYLPPNFHLLLVGKSQPIIGIPYLKKVLKINRKKIHYLGYLQKQQYLSVLEMADIYISASNYEACQLVPLDALFLRKKVVTTTAGAIPDFLSKDYPYFLKSNDPSEISKIILKARLSNQYESSFIKSYPKTWKVIGEEISKIYDFILKS